MQYNKAIAKLTALAATTTFPRNNPAYERFSQQLGEVVRANFGAAAAERLTFDLDKGQFCFTQQAFVRRFGGATVRVEQHFWIDPAKPLAAELERVEAELSGFRALTRRLDNMLNGNGGV